MWLCGDVLTSSSILILVLPELYWWFPDNWRRDSGTCRESFLRWLSWGCWFWRCLLSWFFVEKVSVQPNTLQGKNRPSEWRCKWRLSCDSSLKKLGQRLQANSPRGAIWVLIVIPCVPRWWLSCVTVWNFFGHWLQTYCWILWCVFMWLLRLVTWAKDLPQLTSMHTNGRSPLKKINFFRNCTSFPIFYQLLKHFPSWKGIEDFPNSKRVTCMESTMIV